MGIGHLCRFSNLGTNFYAMYIKQSLFCPLAINSEVFKKSFYGFTQKDLRVKTELGGRYTFFTGRKPRPSPDRHFN